MVAIKTLLNYKRLNLGKRILKICVCKKYRFSFKNLELFEETKYF